MEQAVTSPIVSKSIALWNAVKRAEFYTTYLANISVCSFALQNVIDNIIMEVNHGNYGYCC